ncbi:MAG: hypothetical protein DRQ88_06065 [Epsilonproteobacteria bacterium]|nr:MAG: hypothetical protein DRQ88_06065 [Campylobacterota bacterium]
MSIWINRVKLNRIEDPNLQTGEEVSETKDYHCPYVADKTFERSLLESEKGHFVAERSKEGFGPEIFGGPYSYYNQCREKICKAVTGEDINYVWGKIEGMKELPYERGIYHLLNFSDCEGFIGPTALKEIKEDLSGMSFKGKGLDEHTIDFLTNLRDIEVANNDYLIFW